MGARIASILQERVKEDELAARQNSDQNVKRKRYKVVLHSSPFLRCIQTSIGISAGLAQDSTPFGPFDLDRESLPPTPPLVHGARPKPIITDTLRDSPDRSVKIRKSVLRLDAFLGEWLSPTYFELITPPPESVMMLASARAELLRREDYVQYPNFSTHNHSNSQGQLWSPVSRTGPGSLPSDGAFDGLGTMSTMSGALPRSPSISSQSSQRSEGSLASTPRTDVSGYVSPVPHYAVHNNNTIPQGYVAHARDACAAIDYQWDSMRPPLNWGDGGSFPEEWTDMHKRFRAGVQKLVDWYSVTSDPTEMVTKTVGRGPRKDSDDSAIEDDDIETEAVVVMVSHGAGCNALIGAITHQPVLLEVAMTSLTMAVRKPDVTHCQGLNGAQTTQDMPRVHELYDLKLFANTDHIRSPPSTPASSRSPSVATVMNGSRARHSSFSSPLSNFSWNDNNSSRASSVNTAVGGFRSRPQNNTPATSSRLAFGTSAGGITVGSGMTSFGTTKTSTFGHRPSIGLWSPISAADEDDEDDDNMVLNFSHETQSSSSVVTPKAVQETNSSPYFTGSDNNESLSVPNDNTASGISPSSTPKLDIENPRGGAGGLWGGGPRPPEDADRLRDLTSTKRRWTVTERS